MWQHMGAQHMQQKQLFVKKPCISLSCSHAYREEKSRLQQQAVIRCTCPGSPLPPCGVPGPKYLCLLLWPSGTPVNYACVRSRSPRPMSPLQEERVAIHDGQDRRCCGWWQFWMMEMMMKRVALCHPVRPQFMRLHRWRGFLSQQSRRFTANSSRSKECKRVETQLVGGQQQWKSRAMKRVRGVEKRKARQYHSREWKAEGRVEQSIEW